MKLSDFDYKYPKELVAQRPLPRRDASRMMIITRAAKTISHGRITDLPSLLKENDLVVVNDSKVVPARLFGRRENGEPVELLAVEKSGSNWRCLLKNVRRIKNGERFSFGACATATVRGREDIYLLVEFTDQSFELTAKYHGVPPLPPYIERKGYEAYTNEDRERYQTVYAKKPGSSAAPTAGFHLTNELIEKILKQGTHFTSVTLHVGVDTFAPVRTDDIEKHKMHGERIEISERTVKAISRAKGKERRVVAVGTTTVRALESACSTYPSISDQRTATMPITHGKWTTGLFITPSYKFRIVDGLLTNFHQPKSTLLMLVSAFAGREFALSCYEEAIKENYRLFSYGDCMLIL